MNVLDRAHGLLAYVLIGGLIALVGSSGDAIAYDEPAGYLEGPSSVAALINVSSASGESFYLGQFCTGVLVDQRSVVAASHCVDGRNAHDIAVVIGVSNLCRRDLNPEVVLVDRIAQLPVEQAWDQSLLVLRSNVERRYWAELRASAEPVSQLRVYGWGLDGDGQPTCSLRSHLLVTVPARSCERAGLGPRHLILCAVPAPGSSNTCAGDSGAPAFDESGRLVALVSLGTGCGAGDLGSYGRVHEVASVVCHAWRGLL